MTYKKLWKSKRWMIIDMILTTLLTIFGVRYIVRKFKDF